jgi:hypothetical protein
MAFICELTSLTNTKTAGNSRDSMFIGGISDVDTSAPLFVVTIVEADI